MLTLLLAAAVQAAPVAPAPAAEPPIAALAKAFSGCIRGKLPMVPATLSPEAGADEVIKQCAAERSALEQHVEGMIAQAPEAQKAGTRAEYQAAMAQVRPELVKAITAMRTAKSR